MNYQETGYPFLRYYNEQRQNLIKTKLYETGYELDNEKFFLSTNFSDWYEADSNINSYMSYREYCNPFTPNMIWGLTIKMK